MGLWSYNFYENDVASDVKDTYLSLKSSNQSSKSIENKILQCFSSALDDEEDKAIVILALADLQCQYNEINKTTKAMTLKLIKDDENTFFLKCDEPLKTERKKFLQNLLLRLNDSCSESVSTKNEVKKQALACDWNIGDVFAYKLDSSYSKECGINNQFAIIIVIDRVIISPGEEGTTIWVKITSDQKIPTNVKEINELEFVQIYIRFKDEKIDYFNLDRKIDEEETIPIYRVNLVRNYKRTVPKKLIYLGNYKNIISPEQEFISSEITDFPMIMWKVFEKKLTERYRLYNKKEFFK